MKRVGVPGTNSLIFCDVSTNWVRSFVTKSFRRADFNTIHRLAHPGINMTVKLVTERYVWPSIKSDCRRWARACISCERNKMTKHMQSPLERFSPSETFEHIQIDTVVLSVSEGYRYCLICVDKFTY